MEEAIYKAISEIITGLVFDKENRDPLKNIDDVKTVVDHNNYYKVLSHRESFSYLFNGRFIEYNSINVQNNDIRRSINDLLSSKSDLLYICDLSSAESLKYGVYIVRMMSKNLLPIWFGVNGKIPLLKTNLKNIDKSKKVHFFD